MFTSNCGNQDNINFYRVTDDPLGGKVSLKALNYQNFPQFQPFEIEKVQSSYCVWKLLLQKHYSNLSVLRIIITFRAIVSSVQILAVSAFSGFRIAKSFIC